MPIQLMEVSRPLYQMSSRTTTTRRFLRVHTQGWERSSTYHHNLCQLVLDIHGLRIHRSCPMSFSISTDGGTYVVPERWAREMLLMPIGGKADFQSMISTN